MNGVGLVIALVLALSTGCVDGQSRPQQTDTDVAREIADSLRKSGIAGRGIEITCLNGRVELYGDVFDEASILRASQPAQAVDRKLVIDNRLRVASSVASVDSSSVPTADGELSVDQKGEQSRGDKELSAMSNQEVAQAIAEEIAASGLNGHDIEIRYKDGEVALKGVVGSEEEVAAAAKAVLAVVPNVRRLENDLTVKSRVGDSDDMLGASLSANSAPTSAPSGTAIEPETDANTKQQKRRAVILIMLVAGIALTGLLLLIAAIVARGFLREAQYRAETRRQAEFKRSADVLKEAVESSCNDAGDSVPLSERETEIT